MAKDEMTATAPVELLICTTCRRGLPSDTEGPRPGALLTAALLDRDWPENVTVRGVECLSNCDTGCSVAVRGGPNRWTYVYGNLTETDHVDIVHEGITKYAATADGLVPWRERPEHFRKNCIARIPPLELPNV